MNRFRGKFWKSGGFRLPGIFPVSIEGTATEVEPEYVEVFWNQVEEAANLAKFG